MWPLLIATHALAASVALLLGAWQLFRPTKGDHLHGLAGRAWIVLIMYVAITSFWIRDIRDGQFSLLHVLSVVTIVTTSLGVFNAMSGNIAAHRGNMIGTWLGLVGAFIGAVAVPDRLIPTFVMTEPVGALTAFLSVVAATAVVLTVATTVVSAGSRAVDSRR